MHIADGILSVPVLAAGAGLTAAGVAVGLRGLSHERVPQAAVLASAFFVGSLIHVPVGPSSVHLILNGLAGVVLGWAVFPALLVALLLQAILFGYGGLTVLGVNTVVMALPAVGCYYLFGRALRSPRERIVFAAGFAAGACAVAGSGLLAGLALGASDKEFLPAAGVILAAHVPIMVIEGMVTASVAVFLRKVRPEVLEAARA